MPAHVNYDAIASTYNQRFEEERPSGTLMALEELVRVSKAGRILEVGCGTGHWLAGLRGPDCQLYGLDFSAGMLKQAQEGESALALSQGRGEDLPFPDRSFDLVYCVNALHHFQRQDDFIRQARRVLKPGSALAVLGMDPHHHRNDWYVYNYFPGTFETDLERFSSWGQVLDWMISAGFERVELRIAEEVVKPKYGAAVLEDPFLAKNSCSQLALLSDQAYQAGLNRIRQALADAEARGELLVFPNTLQIHILVGWIK
jgi:ubiquinone/menaquinone biosynthesis C-methylase UbiE